MSKYAYSFDDLRSDILGVMQSMSAARAAQQKLDEAMAADLARLWADNAELRDELHAVANRLEALTRSITTDPAEVAEALVRKYGVPCSECGAPVYVDRLDTQLPSPIRNAADGSLHTCDADAANVRRMAKEY